jgi:peptidoglycan/LPS O-acetylase OafA/YrhL
VLSPIASLRLLGVRPSGQLGPLDGLRAFAILWVLAFHAAWYSLRYIPTDLYVAMLRAPAMLPVWRGDFGVDLFFVLSGFLIAGLLLDEKSATGKVQLGRFYLRRMLRLWPSLVVVVLFDQALMHDNPERAWLTLLYASDFVSAWRVCMAWSWSLAIEAQFYLIAPWLVLPRGRAVRVALLLMASCAVAAWVVTHGSFHAADAEIVVTRRPSQWVRAFDSLYAKPWMRVGPILAGVMAALAYRNPRFMLRLSTAGWKATAMLLLSLGVAAYATHWPLVEFAPRAVEVAFLAGFRAAFGLAMAFVLLLSVSQHALGLAIGRFLSATAFIPVAHLSYAAYLVNPLVAMTLHPVLARWALSAQIPPLALFWPIDTAVTLAVALPLHVLIERPIMSLRPLARSRASL